MSVKREIASNLAVVDIQLNCDMLSALNSKSDNQCLREEASAFQLFQEHQVYKRLQLTPDKYFSQLKTTAFKKVSFLGWMNPSLSTFLKYVFYELSYS